MGDRRRVAIGSFLSGLTVKAGGYSRYKLVLPLSSNVGVTRFSIAFVPGLKQRSAEGLHLIERLPFQSDRDWLVELFCCAVRHCARSGGINASSYMTPPCYFFALPVVPILAAALIALTTSCVAGVTRRLARSIRPYGGRYPRRRAGTMASVPCF